MQGQECMKGRILKGLIKAFFKLKAESLKQKADSLKLKVESRKLKAKS
jgi:hypothetical protein